MSVLVIAEISKGKVKKASLEASNYAAKIAAQLNTSVTAVFIGNSDAALLAELGKAGATKVLQIKNEKLANSDSQLMTIALEQAATAEQADVIVFSHDFTSKAIAPRLAARLKA